MKKKYFIGIDIGATNTKFALLNKNAKVISKKTNNKRFCHGG